MYPTKARRGELTTTLSGTLRASNPHALMRG
jgi:hypothetical protein